MYEGARLGRNQRNRATSPSLLQEADLEERSINCFQCNGPEDRKGEGGKKKAFDHYIETAATLKTSLMYNFRVMNVMGGHLTLSLPLRNHVKVVKSTIQFTNKENLTNSSQSSNAI